MNGYKFFTLTIAFAFIQFCLGQNLELVENKGQWDPAVKFKGELLNGAFFLGSHGYRVMQQNGDDLDKIHDMMHGHHDENKDLKIVTNSADNKTTSAKNNPAPISNDAVVLHSHAYEVTFDQSSADPEIVPEKPQIGYNNYILGNDVKQQGGKCKIYGGALYKNMYPGIDVRYYSNRGNLKYDIIVQPNADISKLALKYEGTDGLSIKDNELTIKTSVGNLTEKFPYSYQLIDGIRTQVGCKFKIFGKTVKYELAKYDHSKTLVIDPTLVFCSFVGSTADNWGYTATYGPDGSMFGGGIVFGAGYPISNGAYQTTFGGGSTTTGEQGAYDIGIIKLSADGSQRIYATYVGGSGNEAPHSMVVDPQGNLIVAGRTTSTNFPTKTANYGATGSWDIVVFKLSADGSALIGSIKVGGTADDGVNIKNKYANLYGVNGASAISLQQNYGDDSRSEVILNGNSILLSSCSQSKDLDFIGIANSAQPTKAVTPTTASRENQDGLLLKFDNNLTALQYGTFIGGTLDDAAYVLSASPITGNIFVGGATSSTNLPGDHSNTVGTAFTTNGTINGFVNEYSPTGTLLKSSYIGTTTGNTQVYGLKFDRFGFPYIMGTTTGNFTLLNSAFGQNGGKQFIGKLSKDLSSYVYFTAFGSGGSFPNISPIAFLVDRCENVYLSGWGGDIFGNSNPQPFPTSGTAGLPLTPDAIQSTTDNRDMYFFVLKKDAVSQLYGSYFGQNGGFTDHVDGGTSRFDEAGIIYQAICANCGGKAAFPVTPGVWGPVNKGTDCNEAMVKIAFNFSGVHSGVKASIGTVDGDTAGCVPLTINFRDTIALAQSYIWDFGDGSPQVTTLTANIAHTYNALGTFQVRLVATDTTKCFPYDTTYTNVRIRPDIAILAATAAKLPPCTSTAYRFTNNSIPYPGKAFGNASFLWIWGDNSPNVVAAQTPALTHTFPGIGTYNVKLVLNDTNFCNSPDTFLLPVRISPNVKASVNTPLSGCAPYNAVFNNTSLGGTSFFWDFGDGNTSTAISPTELYPTPGIYTVKLIATDTSSCNFVDSTTFTITVSGKPTSAFSYLPDPPKQNVITTFANLSNGATRYNWLYGDGDTLLTFRLDTTVRHIYNETKLYRPCLVAINQFNCPDTSCQSLNAIVAPILDVPNAFTPNGDGANDYAVVVGIGITKMTFRIYNRLGQMVFETNSFKQGWNGTYNGKPQPMDAYGYTLDAQFFDGKSVKKSGSITLLR